MPDYPATSTHDPSLKDLLTDIWAARWFVIVFALFAMAAAFAFVHQTPGYYRASMVIGPALAPPDTVSAHTARTQDDSFTSPASFLRHNQRDQRRDSFTRLEIVLKGQAVAEQLARRPDIKKGVRLDSWNHDKKHNQLRADDLREYLTKTLDIQPISDTSMLRLVYSHPSADFAGEFLKQVFTFADTHIKTQDRADIASRVQHLESSLKNAHNTEVRRALAFLLTLEDQRLMLVSSRGQYAGQIVDPVSLSPDPIWPRLSVFVAFALIVGSFFGYAVFAVWRAVRS